MDILNDLYPLYPENPDPAHYTEHEQELSNKRKKELTFDDYCAVHSDDIWYLWCMVQEFRQTSNNSLLDTLDYATFCSLCYENSSKY